MGGLKDFSSKEISVAQYQILQLVKGMQFRVPNTPLFESKESAYRYIDRHLIHKGNKSYPYDLAAWPYTGPNNPFATPVPVLRIQA